MKHLLAVYGTLRKGFHNAYLLRDSKLLGEEIISGFRMHSLGSYPALNKSDTSEIKAEIYEISKPEILNQIYSLEGYSGKRDHEKNWYDTVDVETSFGTAEIFYMKKDLSEQCPLVNDGVWK